MRNANHLFDWRFLLHTYRVIYLINLSSTSLYKIGKTTNITKRIKQLQTAASFPLIVIKTFESPYDGKVETTVHRRFSAYKTSGEWFDFDLMAIHNVIENIEQIQNNIIALMNPPDR